MMKKTVPKFKIEVAFITNISSILKLFLCCEFVKFIIHFEFYLVKEETGDKRDIYTNLFFPPQNNYICLLKISRI